MKGADNTEEESLWGYTDPLEWIIRNALNLEKAQGRAAELLREAYRRGREGLDFLEIEHFSGDMPKRGADSLAALASRAYCLGIEDAERRGEDGHYKNTVRRGGPCVGRHNDISGALAPY